MPWMYDTMLNDNETKERKIEIPWKTAETTKKSTASSMGEGQMKEFKIFLATNLNEAKENVHKKFGRP